VARIARIVWTGCPYHVTHRGNRGGAVFVQESDYLVYLDMLSSNSVREGLKVWAYCLMPNHVHLIVVGENVNSMARALGNTHRRHAQRLNGHQGWTGHLWANRFYSTPMDERHLWVAVRYVELNPVRAGLVENPTDFRWSSARAHSANAKDGLLAPERPFPGSVEDWTAWLLEGVDNSQLDAIRLNTSTGRPSGSADFARDLEGRIGRSVRARSRRRSTRVGTVDKRLLSP
jgi:putative transposase